MPATMYKRHLTFHAAWKDCLWCIYFRTILSFLDKSLYTYQFYYTSCVCVFFAFQRDMLTIRPQKKTNMEKTMRNNN